MVAPRVLLLASCGLPSLVLAAAPEPPGWTAPLLLGAAALGLILVLMFNSLVRRRNAVENAFAGIDVQLLQRYDLIPNLVAVVQGYAEHERTTLTALTELRAEALQGGLDSNRRVQIDNRLSQSLHQVFGVVERYPALRATEQFQQLQRALNEVEERLSASRRAFNAAIVDYNNGIELIPLNLMAAMMGLRRRAFFESAPEARAAIGVGGGFSD